MRVIGSGRPHGLLLALGLAAGCYQGLDAAPEGVDAEDEAAADGADDDAASEDPPAVEDCEGAPTLALRFLTRREYDNTIRDLFGEPLDVTATFSPDEEVGGYLANSTLAPSSTQLERFLDAAHDLGQRATGESLDRFVSCTPEEAGCAAQFVAEFGRRAFRRPLSAEEIEAYVGDFDDIAATQGAALGLGVVAEAMLASPHFLYIGERSALADPQARAYDLASRLSYFVWATMPDDALLDAAATGQLSTRAEVEAQVRRMLQDDRAADMLASFSTQWLEIGELAQTSTKHPESFPEWTPTLADAAEDESARLMQRVVLEGDARLASVLGSTEAYVDEALAALYGVPTPAGGAGWVQLPADERAGLLTRVAFLGRHAHADQNSWVHRGKVVRERLLCDTLPPPPPVADDSPINDDSRLEDAACAGCHQLMDPIGVGFESYDPIGRYVGGAAPGEVLGLEDPGFDGALELSERLAGSDQVYACFAEQLYRYANRRAIEAGDACVVEALAAQLRETDGDIVELIVALTTADGFIGEGA